MKNPFVYIAIALLAASAASCSHRGEPDGREAIGVQVLLDGGTPAEQTRAAGMTFASGDQLLTYIRHVTWNGETTGTRTSVSADGAPALVTLTVNGSAAYSGGDITPIGLTSALGLTADNTQQATGYTATYTKGGNTITGLYWDDFSESTNDGAKDLRTSGHYLQSYYGYCYNGGTPSPALTETSGELGWTVQTDQNTDATAFQHSDLLWSAEQTPVQYMHVDGQGAKKHGTLVLPYTHAMSKVSIVVTASDGFAADYNFSGTNIALNNMFTTCTCTAPTYTMTQKGTDAGTGNVTDITMKRGTAENKKCTYEAIVVPSVLSIGNNLATITGMDDNTYTIPITAAMLQAADAAGNGWGGQLTTADESIQNGTAQAPGRGAAAATTTISRGQGHEMKSGVHYVLNVTVSKQQITVSATIKDWIPVEAEGRAEVLFENDVTTTGEINEALRAGGFDVYKSSAYNNWTAGKATTLSWNESTNKWTYDPIIYWAGQSDDSYFRALAPVKDSAGELLNTNLSSLQQGVDYLWGHSLKEGAQEEEKVGQSTESAISPRTGNVPLHFHHAATKLTIKLETADNDHAAAKVDFDGATLALTNLATTGSINLTTGEITAATLLTEAAYSTTHTATNSAQYALTIVSGVCFIPQTIGENAKLKLTLKNGTTYSLQLNKCVDSGSAADPKLPISEWKQGNHYTYTIHVEKEAISFSALVEDWVEASGSGNATLDWD